MNLFAIHFWSLPQKCQNFDNMNGPGSEHNVSILPEMCGFNMFQSSPKEWLWMGWPHCQSYCKGELKQSFLDQSSFNPLKPGQVLDLIRMVFRIRGMTLFDYSHYFPIILYSHYIIFPFSPHHIRFYNLSWSAKSYAICHVVFNTAMGHCQLKKVVKSPKAWDILRDFPKPGLVEIVDIPRGAVGLARQYVPTIFDDISILIA